MGNLNLIQLTGCIHSGGFVYRISPNLEFWIIKKGTGRNFNFKLPQVLINLPSNTGFFAPITPQLRLNVIFIYSKLYELIRRKYVANNYLHKRTTPNTWIQTLLVRIRCLFNQTKTLFKNVIIYSANAYQPEVGNH